MVERQWRLRAVFAAVGVVAIADRLAGEAEQSLKKGHSASARDGLMRASSYYRSAEFFLHADPGDPRVKYSYERSVACFAEAGGLFSPPIEPVSIPYDGTVLHGYFYRGGPGTRPAIVMHNGFDGSAEEMHYFGAAAAAERGFGVLHYDEHFDRLASVLGFTSQWVAPAGSIS